MRQERGQDFQNDFSDASKSEIKNIGGEAKVKKIVAKRYSNSDRGKNIEATREVEIQNRWEINCKTQSDRMTVG